MLLSQSFLTSAAQGLSITMRIPTVAIASAVLRVVRVADRVLVHWANVSESGSRQLVSEGEGNRTYVGSHQLWPRVGKTTHVRMAYGTRRYPMISVYDRRGVAQHTRSVPAVIGVLSTG